MNTSSQQETGGAQCAAIVPGAAVSESLPSASGLPVCQVRDLGRRPYAEALAVQHDLVARRKRGEIPDTLLFVEHPHVVTMGRAGGRAGGRGESAHLLTSPEMLRRQGIEFHESDRGGDVTYHGPGQIVGYPIFDLREWKRDVVAYIRGLERVLIEALAEFGIEGFVEEGATGVWVNATQTSVPPSSSPDQARQERSQTQKIAAMGVHVSRWVTSHGFALNHETDLNYFGYIVPCGLTRPVTSMARIGVSVSRAEVIGTLSRAFGRVFSRRMARRIE